MAKKIGLKQLAQKKYSLISGLSDQWKRSIGEVEDCFDMIIFGHSGNGKSNFTVALLKELILQTNGKCVYVSYEEGHAKTVQDTFIARHDMLEAVGNKLEIADGYSFDELMALMSKRQSAKMWVIDSIQYAGFSLDQVKKLKEKFIKGKKRKIVIYISHALGKQPDGRVAAKIEYDAHIKIRIENLVAFPKSRYGGNKPYIIWEEKAIEKWGLRQVNRFKK